MSISLLRRLLMKEAVKDTAGSSGIMSINKKIADKVEQQVQRYVNDAMQQGVDLDTLSPEQLKMIVQMNKPQPPRVIAADSPEGRGITEALLGKRGEVVDMAGKKLDTSQGIMGGKSVKELMDSGQVSKGARGMKKSKKVTDREMFQDANKRFKKKEEPIDPDFYDGPFDNEAEKIAEIKMSNEGFISDTIAKIKSMEPIAAMKEANSVIGRKGKYKNLTQEQSKKILQDTEDHIFQRDPDNLYDPDSEDFASGGIARIGLKGGLTPSDYLKVKDMLEHYHKYKKSGKPRISKADFAREFFRENNADGGRIGLAGGGMGRRGFLKLLGSLGAGAAALKTGILGLGGKQAGKEVVKEVAQSAGSGTPPPYFFKLVDKIKTMGDDILATQDKAIAKKYKDYVMEEDFAGNITIIKKNMDDPYPEEVIMSYKVDDVPIKGKKGSTKVEEYEEYTARPDMDGKMKDIEDGVPDEVVEEGTMFEDTMTEFGKTKKASGGIARMLGE